MFTTQTIFKQCFNDRIIKSNKIVGQTSLTDDFHYDISNSFDFDEIVLTSSSQHRGNCMSNRCVRVCIANSVGIISSTTIIILIIVAIYFFLIAIASAYTLIYLLFTIWSFQSRLNLL